MKTTALLIVDMLNDFFEPTYGGGVHAGMRGELTRAINRLIAVFRAQDLPVVWVRQEFRPDLSDAPLASRREHIIRTIAGTPGCLVLPELDKRPDDLEVVKKRFSAFFGTDLAFRLREMGVETLVVCGVKTHACVRTTALDAYQHDFDVLVPRDCVASSDMAEHKATLAYLNLGLAEVCDSGEVIEGIGGEM
jgi:nicotinamidase-related amidase